MEKQIKETYYKAFFDLIDENVNSENPDYDWIVKLYIEMKQRLLSFMKKSNRMYKAIDESFDVELFDQMIRNDVFNAESMRKLVNITFCLIMELQAEYRDKDTEDALNRVLSADPTKVVSVFLKEVHMCIDNLEKDMFDFFSEYKKCCIK